MERERTSERVTKRRSRRKGRVSTRGVGNHEERNQRFKLYIDIKREKKVTLRRAQNLINTKLCLEVTTKHRVITMM